MENALVRLWSEVGAPASGVALACVGSLARRELGPRSDLDLVLLHDGRQPKGDGGIDGLSERLWYPLWDARVKMDHSVRTPAECTAVAGREVSAGVGLLDLRVVAGDGALVSGARTALLTAWRTNARRRLPELLDSLDERRATFGDAAYLLEPDLKEARGGFRDMTMLRALAATWLTDRPHATVEGPYERLLDVRDALHLVSGRNLDRLLAAEIGEVATTLGHAEPDDLHREVSLDARRIGHAVDLTSRAARQSVPQRRVLSFARRERRPDYRTAEHGLIVHNGEVGLARVETADNPLAGLWAGALAAREGLMISPVTAENLGARVSPLPDPWPEPARDAFVTMLASGASLLPVWEALDLAGAITCWLPEWSAIRARPQHNPVHRHTVDRHSVQTVVEAHRNLTNVDRPDLLLLACLLHDIGKLPGAGADHPAVGAPIARAVVDRIGLGHDDAELVARLVREHLTLAELATRRDHADPKTQDALVAAVDGRSDVLALLRYLTEADARAAGPAAWSPWRASLINALADQVEGLLVDGGSAGEGARVDVARLVDLGMARSVAVDGRPRVQVESRPGGVDLMIAAPDRLGLFSDTAGLLAAHGVQVRAAVLHTVGTVAVNTWRIDKERPGDLPDPAFLVQQLERLDAGDRGALDPVRRRESRAQPQGAAAEVHIESVGDASESASVLEVRTGDRPGLLWALGAALSSRGLLIRSAHASTLAGQAIDTFYVTDAEGRRPGPEQDRQALDALAAAARAETVEAG